MDEPRSGWLTAKRLRVHGWLLAVALWSLYIWTLSTPGLRDRNGNFKGTDFLHFYTLGSIALAHRGVDLYRMDAQESLAVQRVPESAGIHYLSLYPPQVSILFAPLACLSYGSALSIWWACCCMIYALCCYGVWRSCPSLRNHSGTVAVLAVAFPGFFNLIAWGQTSAIGLACFTLMFLLLRSQRAFLAGLALGCLIFKPQLGLAAAVAIIGAGAWRVIAGAILSAVTQLCVGSMYYGLDPLREWIQMLVHVRAVFPLLEPRPYQTHCLRTFWTMILPWPRLAAALYAVTAIVILALAVSAWRKKAPLALRFSVLLLATVLVAPHLTVYDLVILAPAILLLTDWVISQNRGTPIAGPVLYLTYALPLLGPLTRWTHVQLSVVAMAALVYLVWRSCIQNEDRMRLKTSPAE